MVLELFQQGRLTSRGWEGGKRSPAGGKKWLKRPREEKGRGGYQGEVNQEGGRQ